MKQIEVSKWLKGITIVLGIMGMIFFAFIVPLLAGEMRRDYSEVAYLYWPGLIYSWVIAAGCYIILFQFWKVCCEIGKDQSFSKENAKSFVIMSKISLFISLVWFAGMLFLGVKNCLAGPIMLLIIFGIVVFIILAILTAALSHLIMKAYDLKQQSDLTI